MTLPNVSNCRRFTHSAIFLAALCSTAAGQDYHQAVLNDNPIAYWLLEEPGGPTAFDSSPNDPEVELTYSNFLGGFDIPGPFDDGTTGVQFTPDAGGNPVLFAGNSTDLGFEAGDSFSIEYWIKAAPNHASAQHAGVLTKGYGGQWVNERPWYLSRMELGGTVDFFLRDLNNTNSVATSSTSVADDQWHYVVGVYDSNLAEVQLYVDSVLESAAGGVPPADYGTNAGPFMLGNHLDRALDAALDEVAIYDYPLTAEQILAHFTEGGGILPPPPPPPINLDVDFGSSANTGGGPGGAQRGFFAFEGDEAGGTDAITAAVPTLLGVEQSVDLTLSGYTHFRDYAAVDARDTSVNRLLSDMVLRNSDGTLSMTLEDLLPGTYEMTTFHHSTQFGGGVIDISVSDSQGAGQNVATALPVSASDGGPLTSTVFNFTTDGSPVTVDLFGGESQQHLSLNGFRIKPADLRERLELLTVDINDRGFSESIDPAVTQDGFFEFLLDGIENDDVATESERDVDGFGVVISSPAGNLIGDRRRDEPMNGAFFTDGELLKDFIFARGASPDEGIDVFVSGLPGNQLVEVTVWSADDGSPTTRVADWFANGAEVVSDYGFDGGDIPPSPPFNDTYSFTFEATTNESGELTFSGRQSGTIDPGVFLNAFSIALILDAELVCDFDGNDGCALADIDALLDAIGSNDATFDLDDSGTVDEQDVIEWLTSAGNENIGRAYLPGDATLDGNVDAADLNAVGLNWQATAVSWAQGDFDGSQFVDAGDLNILGLNWQKTAAVAAAVPEPSGIGLLLISLLPLMRRLRA